MRLIVTICRKLTKRGGKMAKKIILNAGHTLKGYGGGAVGFLYESKETRRVVNLVKHYLTGKGHKVILANVDSATSQSAYLQGVTARANEHADADLFVSVHFNAGGGTGTECFTWRGKKTAAAVGICDELSKYGFRNRGVKDGSRLYVIKNTEMPAVLVEVCFLDNKADCELYEKVTVNRVAQAITRGILK